MVQCTAKTLLTRCVPIIFPRVTKQSLKCFQLKITAHKEAELENIHTLPIQAGGVLDRLKLTLKLNFAPAWIEGGCLMSSTAIKINRRGIAQRRIGKSKHLLWHFFATYLCMISISLQKYLSLKRQSITRNLS